MPSRFQVKRMLRAIEVQPASDKLVIVDEDKIRIRG